MVEIKEVNMSKKFNLGNYEMIEIGVAGSVSRGESVGDALGNLEKAIEHYFVHQRTQKKRQSVKVEAPKPPVNEKQQDEKSRIAKAKDDLPSQYQNKLYVHVADGKVCISPLSYLGTELFAEISDFIRNEMGGEYVSAGKESHWKLP